MTAAGSPSPSTRAPWRGFAAGRQRLHRREGETKRKFESVYAGGTLDTPDSGKNSVLLKFYGGCQKMTLGQDLQEDN
uniref:Uncharacterized protein n=1 Tax=Oryza nivara TaxID=4536 RepID=A0A0E0IAR9_ORYNI